MKKRTKKLKNIISKSELEDMMISSLKELSFDEFDKGDFVKVRKIGSEEVEVVLEKLTEDEYKIHRIQELEITMWGKPYWVFSPKNHEHTWRFASSMEKISK